MGALGVVDTGAAAVVAGDAHHVVDAEGGEKLVLMLAFRRRPSLTLAECHDYWRHEHGALAKTIPGVAAYRQLHARPDRTDALAERAGLSSGYDGVASTEFATLTDFASVIGQPEIAATAYADEQKFVDHARSALGLYAVHARWSDRRTQLCHPSRLLG